MKYYMNRFYLIDEKRLFYMGQVFNTLKEALKEVKKESKDLKAGWQICFGALKDTDN